MNALILESKPRQLICGFIAKPDIEKLRAAGIDVRIGSRNCTVQELVTSSSTLPEASP